MESPIASTIKEYIIRAKHNSTVLYVVAEQVEEEARYIKEMKRKTNMRRGN